VTKAEDFFFSSSKPLLGKNSKSFLGKRPPMVMLNPETIEEPRSSSENEIPEDEKTTLGET